MGSKAPQDIFLRPQFAQVEARGMDVLKSSEFTITDEPAQFQNRRMVLQDVAHHEDPVAFRCQLYELPTFLGTERKRFFDIHIFVV